MPLFKVTVEETVARRSEWLVRARNADDARDRYHAGQRVLLDEEDVETTDSNILYVDRAAAAAFHRDTLALLPTETAVKTDSVPTATA